MAQGKVRYAAAPAPRNHKKATWSFVFLHDDKHIICSFSDGKMQKWDCETKLFVGEPWEGEGGDIWELALSPNGDVIACGRDDGSVQQWNTDGEMIEGVWMGHSDTVRSVSWSPSGGHIASGSDDGTILIREIENGKVEVGPIKTGQDWVWSLAYSPSGDRIASGGSNSTLCIWDSNTGNLLVGPINGLGILVTSVVWSSDSSKLYCVSDKFAHVFESVSGTELHRFEHDDYLTSVALSPKHNLLACVGIGGIIQLWDPETSVAPLPKHNLLECVGIRGFMQLLDMESFQPLEKPPRNGVDNYWVSFSRDGRYLAYCGDKSTHRSRITLWLVKDIAPELSQEIQPQSSSFSFEVARPGGDDVEDGRDNTYDNFFQSSEPLHPFETHGSSRLYQLRNLLSPRRLWNVFIPSQHDPLANQSVPLQSRINRGFFSRHTGPQPVTVSASRPKKLWWAVPLALRRLPKNESVGEANGNANAHADQSSSTAAQPLHENQNLAPESGNVNAEAGQSSSAAAQSSSGAVPYSSPQGPQDVQTQHATRRAEEEFDFGCLGNFLHAVGCISIRPRGIASTDHPATS